MHAAHLLIAPSHFRVARAREVYSVFRIEPPYLKVKRRRPARISSSSRLQRRLSWPHDQAPALRIRREACPVSPPTSTCCSTRSRWLERYARAADAGFSRSRCSFLIRMASSRSRPSWRATTWSWCCSTPNPVTSRPASVASSACPASGERLEQTFRDGVELAQRLGCTRLNVLAGNLVRRPELGRPSPRRRWPASSRLAPIAEQAGLPLLIEALNARAEPALLPDQLQAGLELVARGRQPGREVPVRCLPPPDHGGQPDRHDHRNVANIGHVQIGDVPGRHEPGTGEINYPNVFAALDRAGYDGFVGLEYIPAGQTEQGLDAWLPRAARANR